MKTKKKGAKKPKESGDKIAVGGLVVNLKTAKLSCRAEGKSILLLIKPQGRGQVIMIGAVVPKKNLIILSSDGASASLQLNLAALLES
jgi:hypothetical protein